MKKSNFLNINEALDSFFKEKGWDKKRREIHIINSWENIVGITIAKSTRNISIFDTTLYLNIESSVIRNELLMIKSGLINKINKEAGCSLISDIIIR